MENNGFDNDGSQLEVSNPSTKSDEAARSESDQSMHNSESDSVHHSESESVHNSESESVHHSESESVHNSESESVHISELESVHHSESYSERVSEKENNNEASILELPDAKQPSTDPLPHSDTNGVEMSRTNQSPSGPPSNYADVEYHQKTPKEQKGGKRPFFIFFVVVLGLGIIAAVIIGIVLGQSTGKEDPLLGDYTYNHAAVAADHHTCSTIGKDILQKGGSAADAGIAAMLCVGLVNCQSTGIGGGHFTVFYNRTEGAAFAINAREKAPLAATEEMYVGTYNSSTYGGLAVGVPGEFKGYYELHQRAGRLPWREIIEPSVTLARDGFPIGGSLAGAMKSYDHIILNDKNLREVFCDSNGKLLQKDDIIRFPKLAMTLETIALNGSADPFYRGEIAAAIVQEVKERDGIITLEDLARYEAEVDYKPLEIKLGKMKMFSQRPPASGAVASYIMNILDGYNFSPESVSNSKIGLTYHRIAEAFKFGFARRAELGDDDFVDVESLVEYLISESAAEETRRRITDQETHAPEYYDGGELSFKSDGGTTHVSVIDAEGNALALSSTINLYFGSKVLGGTTGIIYNNEMDDFSTPNTTNYFGVPASPTNFIEPEKRPMSSMVPIVVIDEAGDVRLVTGGAGGTTITTSSVLVAMHSLWFGDNVREALERRRIHHQLYPPYVEFEEGIQDEVIRGLAERGHDVEGDSSIAVVQLVTKEGNKIYATSDPRKSGHGADGY